MQQIEYSWFTREDAQDVAELMVRNTFWMGKADPEMDGAGFLEYQEHNGFLFGVVGRVSDQAVVYVGGYRKGSQRICTEQQILMSGLIIDRRFRTALFSIAEMFKMILTYAAEHGYRELLSEIRQDNYPSLLMMKSLGYVLLDDRPTVYGELVMHNYVPAIMAMMPANNPVNHLYMHWGMQGFSRKRVTEVTRIRRPGFIRIPWKAGTYEYELEISLDESSVVGVGFPKAGFSLFLSEGRKNAVPGAPVYEVHIPDDWAGGRLVLSMKKETGTEETVSISYRSGERFFAAVGEGTAEASFSFPVQGLTFRFLLPPDVREKPETILFSDVPWARLDRSTGYLYCGEKTARFAEMWPCPGKPYLEGLLSPNRCKKLLFCQDNEVITGIENRCGSPGGCSSLYRIYQSDGHGAVSVRTGFRFESCGETPLFHFGIYADIFECRVYLGNGKVICYNQDSRDHIFAELLTVDFRKDESSREMTDRAELSFGEETYLISASEPFWCTVNFNYLSIRFLPRAIPGRTEKTVHFPALYLERTR